MSRRSATIVLAVALIALVAGPAGGHEERPSRFPAEPGVVPTYRTTGPELVVCADDSAERIQDLPDTVRSFNEDLLARCGFSSIQDAVNAVTEQGSRILILPGVYTEDEYAGPAEGECAGQTHGVLSYAQQFECPHAQNLIAIFGDGDDDYECDLPVCRLQIEGTGDDPGDVLIDNRFSKLNAIRADRADEIYLRNFTVQKSEFNSIYILETDGFVIDQVVARWNLEYGFLTFSSDHGLYMDCETYGNGDGGLYPGSAADLHGIRPSIEITRCDSHHNLLGLSGTAGNSLYVHDNKLHHNTVGLVFDSFFPDHPGLPQDSSTVANNEIYSNNEDYYRYWRDGTCEKPLDEIEWEEGVVCPQVGVPIGTGILLAGGNDNLYARNWVYDNWRFGTMQFGVPAAFRNEEAPEKQFDTSHGNRYIQNRMGLTPEGKAEPNGTDFWWDIQGTGNCWDENVAPAGEDVSSDPPVLPSCASPMPAGLPASPRQGLLIPCALWSRPDNVDPAGCDWTQRPPPPS